MRRSLLLPLLLLFALPRCSCDDSPAGTLDGGHDGGHDGGGGGGDAGDLPDAGPGARCVQTGQSCDVSAGATCCSGVCGSDGICVDSDICAPAGQGCAGDLDCCTLSCVNSVCSDVLCKGIGQDCADGSECCTSICGASGTCEPVPPGPSGESCGTLGEACTATTGGSLSGDCCSTNCQGGVCVRAASCQANGDICFSDTDCCGNLCSANDGTAGRCAFETGAGGGGCLQGGNPCQGDGTTCCSRICVDLGAGVPVCQLAGGCRLTGEWCVNNDHCCGGGSNPNGTVACRDAPGRCDNGQSCNPVGNICGAQVLPGGRGVNASQNCCDGRQEVCKLDSAGIPRCFGGCPNNNCPQDCPTGYDPLDPNCCIQAGDQCQFRDQCCNRAPCVPNGNGMLVCGDAPDCVPVGEVCTPGAPPGPDGCCGGLTCAESSVSGTFVCQLDVPGGNENDAGVGHDGGPLPDSGETPDGGTPCAPNGTQCASAAECCSAVCSGGVCGEADQCQPEGTACTASGDCCSGLECEVPVGQTEGTCELGAECGSTGQACSANSPCCSPLRCANSGTLMDCDGTTACVCVIDL